MAIRPYGEYHSHNPMQTDPAQYHRRSIRLRGYDYAQRGVYFLTICAKGWKCLFGEVKNGQVQLSRGGEFVREEWLRSASIRPEIVLDTYVVMPNHFHGIVAIVRDIRRAPRPNDTIPNRKFKSPSRTVGALVRSFKAAVTVRVNQIRGTPGEPVWQRNYYEHIIRDGREFGTMQRYIYENPMLWSKDSYNPDYMQP